MAKILTSFGDRTHNFNDNVFGLQNKIKVVKGKSKGTPFTKLILNIIKIALTS